MSTAELINTGILMGILHVLTGPDHLSALATLCGTNVHAEARNKGESFLLGVRWGLGHSLGLVVVGGLLIAMESSSGEWIGMNPAVSDVLEGFVGVFMLALGVYGIVRANRNDGDSALRSQVVDASASQIKGLALVYDVEHNSDDGDEIRVLEMPYRGGRGDSPDDDCDDVLSRMSQVLDDDSVHANSVAMSRRGSRAALDDASHYSGMDDFSFRDLSNDKALKDYLESAGELDESARVGGAAGAGGPSDMSFVTVPMKQRLQDVARNKIGRATSTVTVDLPIGASSPRGGSRGSSSSGSDDDDSDDSPVPEPYGPAKYLPRRKKGKRRDEPYGGSLRGSGKLMSAASLVNKHQKSRRNLLDDSWRSRMCPPCLGGHGRVECTPGLLALAYGLLHGIAGPGGVLGVIPAVQLRDAYLAMIYLGTFCVTSTFVMGGFAAFYGTLSVWLASGRGGRTNVNRVYMVELGSALLSVCVGTIWLVLLALGKLDEVFP